MERESVILGTTKYIVSLPTGTIELYDLSKDPHQTKNVATEPTYAKTREELEKRLLAELERTGDPRVREDGKFFETPPMAGPVEEPKRRPQR